ncbi:uncharacterized protein [Linepithema humile]|uniref:uncharacterized protein isoform X3 n=1 Tax=Linepithema humile TaxID=83485 RepID=UPI00351E755E
MNKRPSRNKSKIDGKENECNIDTNSVMDFIEKQYLIDGVLYNITETPHNHERLRKDPDFASQYVHRNVFDLKSSQSVMETDNENLDDYSYTDETLQDISNNDMEVQETRDISNLFLVFKWPHEAILLLLEEYNLRQNDFVTGKTSQKKVWSLIADEMVKHGHKVTGAQCLSKFSGLKRTYKAVKDHNNKSGNGTQSWPYFSHMDTLLGSKPFMSPVTTISSTGKRTQSDSSISSGDSCLDTANEKPKKLQKTSYAETLMEDLKEERKIAEEATEKRHKENMEIRLRFLASLEKMVSIMEKNIDIHYQCA